MDDNTKIEITLKDINILLENSIFLVLDAAMVDKEQKEATKILISEMIIDWFSTQL
jgi:hypothetical protein